MHGTNVEVRVDVHEARTSIGALEDSQRVRKSQVVPAADHERKMAGIADRFRHSLACGVSLLDRKFREHIAEIIKRRARRACRESIKLGANNSRALRSTGSAQYIADPGIVGEA